jgi:hypothetical protein
MAALGAMLGRRRPSAGSLRIGALGAGAAVVIGVAAGGALALPSKQPVYAGLALAPVALALLGPEMCIGLLLAAAVGVMPFVDAEATAGGVPVWLLAASGALALMFFSFVVRSIARAPGWRLEPSLLILVSGLLLAFTLQRLASSSPFEIPTLTANIAAFAVVPPVTWLWLSHVDAADGVRRALPALVFVVVVWALMWVAGSAHVCSGCVDAVGSGQQAGGVLGTDRLYASGEAMAGVLVVFALALLVRRPSLWLGGLIVLATTVVILGGSRANYFAVAGGVLLILGWTFRNVGTLSRAIIVVALVVTTLLVVTSPIGQRAGSSYQELRLGSGTGGYRLALLEQTRPSWSVLGLGSSRSTLQSGFTADLGVPNTFLTLGYVGGALQFLVLGLALLRSLRARVTAGVGIAGVMAMILLSRGSLPMLETGPPAVTIGVLVGAAAALMVPRPLADA